MRRLFLIVLLLCSTSAYATVVSYEGTNIAGNTWEYTYSVENDTLAVDIEEFSIIFDLGLYENLVATTTPPDWDPLVLQPDPGLPDDGLYDALALASGISPGDTLGGFSVQFDYLGTGTPGAQTFDIIDPFTFAVLDSGNTRPVATGTAPEPGTLLLFMAGILVIGYRRYQQGTLRLRALVIKW